MSEVLSAKTIWWGYNHSLKNNGDEIELTGIQSFGSILTCRAVEYDKYLNIKFKVFICPNPVDGAAIVDLDFWDGKHSFVSIVLGDSKTSLNIRDAGETRGICSIANLSGWQEFNIYLTHKKVYVSFNNKTYKRRFKRKKKSCTISFGNNVVPFLDGSVLPTSLILKDVVVETENGLFPLDVNKLIFVPSMKIWMNMLGKI
jgi:hypothetical protein